MLRGGDDSRGDDDFDLRCCDCHVDYCDYGGYDEGFRIPRGNSYWNVYHHHHRHHWWKNRQHSTKDELKESLSQDEETTKEEDVPCTLGLYAQGNRTMFRFPHLEKIV